MDFLPIPEIPAEVWEDLKRLQRMQNEITGAYLDMLRSEVERDLKRYREKIDAIEKGKEQSDHQQEH